jgi:hypothetical protein
VQKRQGASTLQKVRTKKPSAQAHNKRKNAKGLRPFKRSKPKNLRHKRTTRAKTQKGLSNGTNQKPTRKRAQQVQSEDQQATSEKSKDGCQKGEGTFFPQEHSASIIRPTRNKKN